jgi:hypothetical protein
MSPRRAAPAATRANANANVKDKDKDKDKANADQATNDRNGPKADDSAARALVIWKHTCITVDPMT